MTAARRPRLSSLLVRLGLVGVDQIKDALFAQVVRGGGLDTVLLEDQRVSEAILLDLICRTSGCTPSPTALWQEPDPDMASMLPAARAKELGVCPLGIVDGSLVLVATECTDPEALADLAHEPNRLEA